jgi:hypothetical protein
VTERPKVRHWKCRARGKPLCRGFKSHPLRHPDPLSDGVSLAVVAVERRSVFDVAVLDGELAVPCSPQSASAGSNPLSRAARVE